MIFHIECDMNLANESMPLAILNFASVFLSWSNCLQLRNQISIYEEQFCSEHVINMVIGDK